MAAAQMSDRSTISAEYRQQQMELHRNPNYGIASLGYAPTVKTVMEQFSVKSLSDYGAGKCNLQKALHGLGKADFAYFPYDPAFPDYGAPRSADLVCCIDVLEHIEPPYLEAVLLDLRDIISNLGFLSIHTGAAVKVLSDGRNAHLIQQPSSWWLPKLCQYFEIAHLQGGPGGFWVLAERKAPAR
jgi:hypothetical protein